MPQISQWEVPVLLRQIFYKSYNHSWTFNKEPNLRSFAGTKFSFSMNFVMLTFKVLPFSVKISRWKQLLASYTQRWNICTYSYWSKQLWGHSKSTFVERGGRGEGGGGRGVLKIKKRIKTNRGRGRGSSLSVRSLCEKKLPNFQTVGRVLSDKLLGSC